jgi:hypothetical protein
MRQFVIALFVMIVTREWYPTWGYLGIGLVPGQHVNVLHVDKKQQSALIRVNNWKLVVPLDQLYDHATKVK